MRKLLLISLMICNFSSISQVKTTSTKVSSSKSITTKKTNKKKVVRKPVLKKRAINHASKDQQIIDSLNDVNFKTKTSK